MVLNSVVSMLLLFSGGTASAFQFPKIKFIGISANEDSDAPWILVQKGPDEANNLRKKVEKTHQTCYQVVYHSVGNPKSERAMRLQMQSSGK